MFARASLSLWLGDRSGAHFSQLTEASFARSSRAGPCKEILCIQRSCGIFASSFRDPCSEMLRVPFKDPCAQSAWVQGYPEFLERSPGQML